MLGIVPGLGGHNVGLVEFGEKSTGKVTANVRTAVKDMLRTLRKGKQRLCTIQVSY